MPPTFLLPCCELQIEAPASAVGRRFVCPWCGCPCRVPGEPDLLRAESPRPPFPLAGPHLVRALRWLTWGPVRPALRESCDAEFVGGFAAVVHALGGGGIGLVRRGELADVVDRRWTGRALRAMAHTAGVVAPRRAGGRPALKRDLIAAMLADPTLRSDLERKLAGVELWVFTEPGRAMLRGPERDRRVQAREDRERRRQIRATEAGWGDDDEGIDDHGDDWKEVHP